MISHTCFVYYNVLSMYYGLHVPKMNTCSLVLLHKWECWPLLGQFRTPIPAVVPEPNFLPESAIYTQV